MLKKLASMFLLFPLLSIVLADCEPPGGDPTPDCYDAYGVTIPNVNWSNTFNVYVWSCCNQNMQCPGSNPNPGIRYYEYYYEYTNGLGNNCWDTTHYYSLYLTPQTCCAFPT